MSNSDALDSAVLVALRVRPLVEKEIRERSRECMSKVPNQPQILVRFLFPALFDVFCCLTLIAVDWNKPLFHI